MLKQIYIENFALIKKLELELNSGFTVFTGETGSGKSIMIDAISFALGKRADKSFVRKDSKKAVIELTFFIKEQTKNILSKILKNEDMYLQEDVVILKREIYSDGRSLFKINSKNVTMTILRKVSEYLINIHGQNEFGELKEGNHINILDEFAKINENSDFKNYQKAFLEFAKLQKKYNELYLNFDKSKNQKEVELLKFEINEIEQLNIGKDEVRELEDGLKVVEKANRISSNIDNLYEDLYGKQNNILKVLKNYLDEFEDFAYLDENLSTMAQRLSDLYYGLEEFTYSLRDMLNKYDYDEDKAILLEDRYNEIKKLFSKYAEGYEGINKYLEKAKEQLENFEKYDSKIEEIKKEMNSLREKMEFYALNINKLRKSQGEKLEKLIKSELETLGMEEVRFKVSINKTEKFNVKGKDEVVFLISFNKGEELKEFSKVASGGEISRFMLALKNIISSKYDKAMIFDEIDTGISGLASEKVGRKLKDISKNREVLCITHQAQIASYAKNHIRVYKEVEGEETITKAEVLNENERIKEIGKMMDANENSKKSMEHAKELLNKNSK